MLFVTGTTLSVPSLMGAIMCVGVATANSILMVTFANDERPHTAGARCRVVGRLYPYSSVLMTASTMILGMLPMALSMGEGGEQNAPLGLRGLLAACWGPPSRRSLSFRSSILICAPNLRLWISRRNWRRGKKPTQRWKQTGYFDGRCPEPVSLERFDRTTTAPRD